MASATENLTFAQQEMDRLLAETVHSFKRQPAFKQIVCCIPNSTEVQDVANSAKEIKRLAALAKSWGGNVSIRFESGYPSGYLMVVTDLGPVSP